MVFISYQIELLQYQKVILTKGTTVHSYKLFLFCIDSLHEL